VEAYLEMYVNSGVEYLVLHGPRDIEEFSHIGQVLRSFSGK
jgi:hypothetical protein